MEKYGLRYDSIRRFSEHYQSTSLPLYHSPFYPKQKEVAIKGTLFPHYILGLYDLEHDCFVLNPYIFKQSRLALENVPAAGFKIDQSDFYEWIRETGYFGYVKRQPSGIYTDERHC